MDLWLQQGAARAFPLAVAVLSRAASSPVPAARARTFDMLLTLSVHGQLLQEDAGLKGVSSEAEASVAAESSGKGTSEHVPQSPAVESPSHIGAESESGDSKHYSGPDAVSFSHWLRLLLYHLLLLLVQVFTHCILNITQLYNSLLQSISLRSTSLLLCNLFVEHTVHAFVRERRKSSRFGQQLQLACCS